MSYMSRRFAATLAVILCAVWLVSPPVSAAEDPAAAVYSIADVPADVTAANANTARDQALSQAERAALTQLLTRLGAGEGLSVKLGDDAIANMVQSFEVQNEKASGVRYIGVFSIQFRPSAVRKFLTAHNVTADENRGAPVLVLPVMTTGGRAVLWEDSTRWRAAWDKTNRASGMVPVVLAAGDLDDIAALSSTEAAAAKAEGIQKLIAKYQTSGAAIVTYDADAAKTGTAKVTVVETDVAGAAQPPLTFEIPQPKDGNADLAMAQAVQQIRRQLEASWRQHAHSETVVAGAEAGAASGEAEVKPPQPGPETHIAASVSAATLAEWGQIRRRLGNVPAITTLSVNSMTRGDIHLDLGYHGSIDDLQNALSAQGLVMRTSVAGGGWVIEDGSIVPR